MPKEDLGSSERRNSGGRKNCAPPVSRPWQLCQSGRGGYERSHQTFESLFVDLLYPLRHCWMMAMWRARDLGKPRDIGLWHTDVDHPLQRRLVLSSRHSVLLNENWARPPLLHTKAIRRRDSPARVRDSLSWYLRLNYPCTRQGSSWKRSLQWEHESTSVKCSPASWPHSQPLRRSGSVAIMAGGV